MVTRINEHEGWMDIAFIVAKRSKCVRSQVGCVIVGADGRVVSTGYNGPPAKYAPGRAFSCAGFCPRHDATERAPDFSDCPSVHAELNALLYARSDELVGATVYITRDPCWSCALAIAASGASYVSWPRSEPTDREASVIALLLSSRIQIMEPYTR